MLPVSFSTGVQHTQANQEIHQQPNEGKTMYPVSRGTPPVASGANAAPPDESAAATNTTSLSPTLSPDEYVLSLTNFTPLAAPPPMVFEGDNFQPLPLPKITLLSFEDPHLLSSLIEVVSQWEETYGAEACDWSTPNTNRGYDPEDADNQLVAMLYTCGEHICRTICSYLDQDLNHSDIIIIASRAPEEGSSSPESSPCDAENLLGVLMGNIGNTQGQSAVISGIVINPDNILCRNTNQDITNRISGVGSLLMNFFCETLVQTECPEIMCKPYVETRGFFEKCGFVVDQ